MNTKKNTIISTVFFVFALLSFTISAFFLYKGYDKMTNYNNSDTFYSKNVNAYVGGDAYNYIINGTYATSFFVLGAAGIVAGTLCSCTAALLSTSEREIAIQAQVVRPQAADLSISEQLPDL